MWFGCAFFNLTLFVPYRKNTKWKETVLQVTHWLASGVKLILVYRNEPDTTGHLSGPESAAMNETLQRLDADLGLLLDSLEQGGFDQLDLIVTSDHGMLAVTKRLVISPRHDLYWTKMNSPSFLFVEPHNGECNKVLVQNLFY